MTHPLSRSASLAAPATLLPSLKPYLSWQL